jgi:hypothetical protein
MEQQIKSGDYWYEHRHELMCGQVFRCRNGDIVRLVGTVPGDGTKWYVDDWYGYWSVEDNTIEPGDIEGDPIADTPAAIALVSAA